MIISLALAIVSGGSYFTTILLKLGHEVVSAERSDPICEIDTSESPQMAEFAKKLPPLCELNYPKIEARLSSDCFEPPRKIRIVFKNNLSGAGETVESTISLSNSWFTDHPDDLGAVVHEMAHVVQSYPPNQPFWLSEGIADYIRYELGYQNSWSYPHCGDGSEHYTSGYWCSAAFLKYIEKRHDKKIVSKLNRSLRENRYSDAIFREITGKNVKQLWQQCRRHDCLGGRP